MKYWILPEFQRDDKHTQHLQTSTRTYLCTLSKADTNCCVQFERLICVWKNQDGLWFFGMHSQTYKRQNCLFQRNSVVPGFHISQFLSAYIYEHTPAHTRQSPVVERSVTMAEFSNWLWTAASAKALVLSETCQCLASVTIIFLCRTAKCETPGLGHYPATFPTAVTCYNGSGDYFCYN